jgi:hypothetical protein
MHHIGLGIQLKVGWKALNKPGSWMPHQDPGALESARNWDYNPGSTWREPQKFGGPAPAERKLPRATLLKIVTLIMHQLAYKIQVAASFARYDSTGLLVVRSRSNSCAMIKATFFGWTSGQYHKCNSWNHWAATEEYFQWGRLSVWKTYLNDGGNVKG